MKKKAVQFLLGVGMSLAVMGGSVVSFAAEEASTEVATEATTEVATETATEAATETETETETNAASDFVEGSAVLSDYAYIAGTLTDDGWKSEFLNMEYIPGKDISMSAEDNNKLEEYYGRNGEDKKVANNEMVAVDKNGGYMQLMAEVNPNHESAEDILARFKENESLDLSGDSKETEIAGKTFLTSTGVSNKERYMVGVCTDQDNIVLAIKVKYKDAAARKAFLEGFASAEKETELESETETEAVSNEEEVTLPEEFENAEVITEVPADAVE